MLSECINIDRDNRKKAKSIDNEGTKLELVG